MVRVRTVHTVCGTNHSLVIETSYHGNMDSSVPVPQCVTLRKDSIVVEVVH